LLLRKLRQKERCGKSMLQNGKECKKDDKKEVKSTAKETNQRLKLLTKKA
jgi:hypothetical protein